jgi:DNA-binding CsgD family transcriptional regulator
MMHIIIFTRNGEEVYMNINSPSFHWVKDKRLRFISCSEGVAQLAGLDSPSQIIGKTDLDMPWADRANHYLEEEKIALSGQEHQQLQLQKTAHGIIKILVSKTPLYNAVGHICGTMGSSIDLSQYFIAKKSAYINHQGKLITSKFSLTSRETQVLKLLLLGGTAKSIGAALKISPRTIDSHIISLKTKFNCFFKQDIARAAIQLGLIFAYDDLSNLY